MDKAVLVADRRARYMLQDRRAERVKGRPDDLQAYAIRTDVQTIVQVVVIIKTVPRAPLSFPPCVLQTLPTFEAPVLLL